MPLPSSVLTHANVRAPKGIVYGPPGVGKAQPLDAQVLTPSGFVPMGAIEVNNQVIGADGIARRVLGVYPQGVKEVFRVTFRDGSATECCDDHLWFTQTITERQQGVAGAVRSLKAIRQTFRYGTRFNHSVPRVQPVEFAAQEDPLPINPWLLGMYLGDGHSGCSAVITNPEPDVQRRIEAALPPGDQCVLFDKISLRISRRGEHGKPSAFMTALREMGLDHLNAEDKFIPNCYLYASVANRLELLRGLLDSDGYVQQPGAVEYCTVSPRLAQDFCFLVRSLGASVKVSSKIPTFTYRGEPRTGQLAYRVYASFTNGIVPVASDKNEGKWQSPEWAIGHTIRTVEPVGPKPCQCIRIDALDGLYVTDDFIVTHNTTFGAGANRPLIVDCENGSAHVSCDRTPYLSRWVAIQQWLDGLAAGGHDYETIVIDSADWLLRRAEEYVSGVDGTENGMRQTLNRSHGGYGNGKQVLKNHVYQYLLPTLDTLVNAGVAVVLLAHATRRELTTIDGISIEKSSPEIHADLVNTMIEWSDFVGAARMTPDGRELVLYETPQLLAKNRYGINVPLPLSWPALLNAMTLPNP